MTLRRRDRVVLPLEVDLGATCARPTRSARRACPAARPPRSRRCSRTPWRPASPRGGARVSRAGARLDSKRDPDRIAFPLPVGGACGRIAGHGRARGRAGRAAGAQPGDPGDVRPLARGGHRRLHRVRARNRADAARVGRAVRPPGRARRDRRRVSRPARSRCSLRASSHGYTALLIWMVLAGMLGSSAIAASGRAVFGWFPRDERGLALGLRQTAVPVGAALASFTLPPLASAAGVDAALYALAGADARSRACRGDLVARRAARRVRGSAGTRRRARSAHLAAERRLVADDRRAGRRDLAAGALPVQRARLDRRARGAGARRRAGRRRGRARVGWPLVRPSR